MGYSRSLAPVSSGFISNCSIPLASYIQLHLPTMSTSFSLFPSTQSTSLAMEPATPPPSAGFYSFTPLLQCLLRLPFLTHYPSPPHAHTRLALDQGSCFAIPGALLGPLGSRWGLSVSAAHNKNSYHMPCAGPYLEDFASTKSFTPCSNSGSGIISMTILQMRKSKARITCAKPHSQEQS